MKLVESVLLLPFAVFVILPPRTCGLEVIDMGEAGGYRYFAKPVRATGEALSGEVIREKPGETEVVAEVNVPLVDSYYAGVSADGKYFYLAGQVEECGEFDVGQFIYLYNMGDPAEPAVKFVTDYGAPPNLGQFEFIDGRLYAVQEFYSSTLIEIDPGTGAVAELLVSHSVELEPEEKAVYYLGEGPDNYDVIERFSGGGYVHLQPEG